MSTNTTGKRFTVIKVNIATSVRLYPSSVNESHQRLIEFMLSVSATKSAAILEQSPGVFVNFDKF